MAGDALPEDPRFDIGDISGRITEAGREAGKNFVTLDCGHGHYITLGGMSDTVTKLQRTIKVLRVYKDCRHACIDCFCTKEARAELFEEAPHDT